MADAVTLESEAVHFIGAGPGAADLITVHLATEGDLKGGDD